ncbi:hypothetical protein GCM10023223_38270 [Stackebrandtia albiflava]
MATIVAHRCDIAVPVAGPSRWASGRAPGVPEGREAVVAALPAVVRQQQPTYSRQQVSQWTLTYRRYLACPLAHTPERTQ